MVQIETVGLAPQLALHRDSCAMAGGDQLLNLKKQHQETPAVAPRFWHTICSGAVGS